MDRQKMLLLRSYSRTSITRKPLSPSGLETLLPRTSTPTPVTAPYVDDKSATDPYEIFRHMLDIPPKKVSVRGMTKPPYDFISGHLVQSPKKSRFDYTTISLDTTGEAKKVTFKSRYASFKKTVKRFFQRTYRKYVRNKCDDSVCPATCECQKVKSLLNKTVLIDGEGQSRVENETRNN